MEYGMQIFLYPYGIEKEQYRYYSCYMRFGATLMSNVWYNFSVCDSGSFVCFHQGYSNGNGEEHLGYS